MKVRPLGSNLLVKRLEGAEVTKGGIVIPDSAKEKPKEGKVIELGNGRQLEKGGRADFQVKKDDHVLFSSYAGTEVKIDGEEYLIMSEEDVLAVIK
ncbi:MAG: co-chaperone GroES [Planctomycetota bacterium]|jgi:chaperonin GroES